MRLKLKLQPFVFSNSDLQAIAQSTMHCRDAATKLIRLLQQIHHFRDSSMTDLTPQETDYFQRLAAKLEADVALALYLCLLESGLITDGYLDLDQLSRQCITKIAL